MKLPHRRQFLHLVAGAAALPAVSRFACAQAYPSRPVRMSLVSPPGGRTTLTRASSANGFRSGSAKHSSSTTDPALVAISPWSRSCDHRPMAIRSSWSR